MPFIGINHGEINIDKQVNVDMKPDAKEPEMKESVNNSHSFLSPVYLAKKKGSKIDLIRIANAIYELGMVEDGNGGRLTKKDFMVAFGQAFNIDLADYDKDLSNSMASSVSYEKQTRIFDEMKEKHQEIYNSK